MPIRLAQYADLWPASQILTAAFKDTELFGEYMHPRRDEYPEDMNLFFIRMLRADYVKGSNDHLIVSYKADASGKEECITGIAHWERFGREASRSVYSTSLQRIVTAYNYLESFIYPDRAADPSTMDVLGRAGPYVNHHWTGTRGKVWNLSVLAVDPKQGRQGFGQELVQWGFARAREEGVGCTVISAAGKEKFYEMCGFDVSVGRVRDEGGDANPLRNVPGGTIHFWDNGIEPMGLKKYGNA